MNFPFSAGFRFVLFKFKSAMPLVKLVYWPIRKKLRNMLLKIRFLSQICCETLSNALQALRVNRGG
ncbi:hypothetical protein A8B74_03020 [Sulfitobacter geojensis]|nr:hypothetical protein A8B74_03020 [Sulfitobacter geojensis]